MRFEHYVCRKGFRGLCRSPWAPGRLSYPPGPILGSALLWRCFCRQEAEPGTQTARVLGTPQNQDPDTPGSRATSPLTMVIVSYACVSHCSSLGLDQKIITECLEFVCVGLLSGFQISVRARTHGMGFRAWAASKHATTETKIPTCSVSLTAPNSRVLV